MEQIKIIEGNKLIAEFMGGVYDGRKYWEFPDGRTLIHSPDYNSQFKYHSSWNWLMQAVEKIEILTTEDGRGEINYIVSIESTSCIVSVGGEGEVVCCQAYDTGKSKIDVTFEAVVEFIKWYNQHERQSR